MLSLAFILSPLVGQGAPSTYRGPALRPESAYAARARGLDDPASIFRAAGYAPLWTATAEEAKGRLPANCTVMPKEARIWEPWFRNELKDGPEVLSTARLLQVREAVALYAYNDDRVRNLVRRLPSVKGAERVGETVAVLDAVRRDALAQVGLKEPSPVLDLILFADMAVHSMLGWARYTRKYQKDWRDRYYPKAQDILGRPELGMECTEASIAEKYIVAQWAETSERRDVFVKQGVFCVSNHRRLAEEDSGGLHAILGLMVKAGERTAYLFWEGVPFDQPDSNDRSRTATPQLSGPLDRASLEYMACTYSVSDYKSQLKERFIGKPPKDNNGVFVDGDEQPFSLGNFVEPVAASQAGKIKARTSGQIVTREDIYSRPLTRWQTASWPQIVALNKAVNMAYSR